MGAGFILTWFSVVYILEPRQETNSSRKYLIATAVVVIAVAGLALGPRAWRWAQREYLGAKQQRSLAHAKDFFAAKDPVAAVAAIEVALSAQPGNAAAWRLAADLVEEAGAREAVQLRRRVVELEPDNPVNRLALALTALRFQELTTAFETFATLPDETKALPEAERLALALSLTGQAPPLADALFADLEKKTPTDARLAFSHAVLLLRHPQVEKAAQARQIVEQFRAKPDYRLPALRELYLDAVARRETDRAVQLAHALAATPGAALGDKLSAANADLIFGRKPFVALQPALAAQASGSAEDAVQFAEWLFVQQRVDEAKAWIAGLPPALAAAGPVLALKADWALRERDWEVLAALLRRGAWGPVTPTALQLAMSASLIDSNENENLRAKLWHEAVKATRGDLASLRILHRLAAGWSWPNEALEVLVAIAEQHPSQTWAHEARVILCRRLNDTRGMLAALDLWRNVDPLSERLRYNAALLRVLLSGAIPGDYSAAMHELDDLYARHTKNPAYLTSAAFALAKSGKPKEAMVRADLLPAPERALAARAPYLAYVYAVGRRYDQAAVFLEKAKGGDFLPEESGLLEFARTAVENPGFSREKSPEKPKR